MDIAALVTWLVTALGGFYLLGTWLTRGGARGGASRFPPALIFGHFTLAAAGLLVWIAYVATDSGALAWIAFGLLVPVALLGFTMLARWVPVYRARARAHTVVGGAAPQTEAEAAVPPERHFPVPVVAGHGLLAATTLVLVFLAAAGVGGS